MPPVLAARARFHFRQLKLARQYGAQAASMLRVLSRTLEGNSGGTGRDYLQEQADLWAKENINGWQAALYRALAENEWYISGGYGEPWH
jgi:hypothetical protein